MRIAAFIPLPATTPTAAHAPEAGPLSRFASTVALRFRLWRQERRTLAEIRVLDEATLRDIGVMRWQLVEHLRDERARIWRGYA